MTELGPLVLFDPCLYSTIHSTALASYSLVLLRAFLKDRVAA